MDWIHNFQLFLFDFDGLLIDTEALHLEAYRRMCSEYGYKLELDIVTYNRVAQFDATGPSKAIYSAFPALKSIEWEILRKRKNQIYLEILSHEAPPLMQGVEELLEKQKKEGARLVKLVIEKGYVSEQDLAVCMGRVLNVTPINIARISIAQELVDLLPRETMHNHRVIPISRLENKLFLAMADPLNVLAIDDVKRITKLEITPLIASEKAIADKLAVFDSSKGGSMEDIIQDAQKRDEENADTLENVQQVVEDVNLDKLAASGEEAPVIKLANLIIVQAIKDRASDIHLEPFEKNMRLRYRVDGVLMDATPPPKQMPAPQLAKPAVPPPGKAPAVPPGGGGR